MQLVIKIDVKLNKFSYDECERIFLLYKNELQYHQRKEKKCLQNYSGRNNCQLSFGLNSDAKNIALLFIHYIHIAVIT